MPFTPYEHRYVTPLGLWQVDDWRVKAYGLARADRPPRRALVDEARSVVADALPDPAETEDRYGVGFAIVHEGTDGDYVLVDHWFSENMLRNQVYWRRAQEPALWPAPAGGPTVCVWELAILAHERQAWIDEVLARDSRGLTAYLDSWLAGPV
jgi:hypothetical protein